VLQAVLVPLGYPVVAHRGICFKEVLVVQHGIISSRVVVLCLVVVQGIQVVVLVVVHGGVISSRAVGLVVRGLNQKVNQLCPVVLVVMLHLDVGIMYFGLDCLHDRHLGVDVASHRLVILHLVNRRSKVHWI
jgi:hypothetical protein